MTRELHIIDVEPNTYMMYLDGKLHDRGDSYMKEEELISLLETGQEFDVTTEHMHFDTWQGSPRTLEEAVATYDDVDGRPS